jgi:hypothetical protein
MRGMAMGISSLKLNLNTKVTFLKTKEKEWELNYTLMATIILVNGAKTSNKGWADTSLLMKTPFLKVNGKKGKSMEKGQLLIR